MTITISVEELGVYVKSKREKKGLNLLKLEAETGISPSTLSRIERGHIPDIEAIRKLAKWLGVSVQAAGAGDELVRKDEDLSQVIEVHLRANKKLSDKAARGIAQSVESFMAWEIKRAKEYEDE